MVSFTLKGAQYEVVEAEDGKDALTKLTAQKFDLIITDLNMPNMDGFELIENVRKGGNHKFTPILILTTESDSAKKERGKASGATGWIVKPFHPDRLLEVVKKVCA
jgi:two-component system chemotaxis response regulator CheY